MNNSLKNAFPIVASALGDRLGVQVRIAGTSACTDGSVIQLPSLEWTDPALHGVAWGFLAHEAAHVRLTDFGLVSQIAPYSIRKAILNILEDVRVERELARIYPGTRFTIENLVKHLIETGGFAPPGKDSPPAAVLQAFLLFFLRSRDLGQAALAGHADDASRLLEAVFPAGMVTRLHGLLSEMPVLDSTRACLALTEKILQMLEEESEKERSQEESEERSQEEGEAGAAPAGDDPQDADTPQGNEAAVSAGSSKGGRDVLRAVLDASDDDLLDDPFEQAAALLKREALEHPGRITLPAAVDPGAHINDIVRRAAAESTRVRAALQGMVQADRMDRAMPGRAGRRVLGHRLHRAAAGDARIFARRDTRRAPDTAVHILVDRSYSMRDRMQIAWSAAASLALALEGIPGVSPAVTAFPGKNERCDSVFRVVDHGQKVMARAHAFGLPADGGTPLAQALWYGAAALLRCRQPRKLLVAITDGEPDDEQSALDILARCRSSGIEAAGIGIQIDIGHLFPAQVRVDEIGGLRKAAFDLTRKLLAPAAPL
ncbi:VWA domain-containing protein [Methylococcus capsulatus]|uniref:VWA domain-containing protein n=1 Tax=Methylococcus capsulatus TaxID=414 RepID=UPI001C529A88|nr:VWA domain-containing protein [Methylococcus capsulatus]QXP89644.1 VWA domain-containing protein [Methylococcus capsulatus]